MRLLRKILGGISLTAAMFVFQACYGTGPDCPYADYTFRVVDAKDGSPIPDIQVTTQMQSNSDYEYPWETVGVTDSTGIAHCYFWKCEAFDIKFRFSDEDSLYAVQDTVISTLTDSIDIVLHRVN